MPPRARLSQAGFTLLEVMIAMTIMTVALGAILTAQSSSVSQSIKAKELNIAGWLAHRVMVESEHLLEGKPFEEIDKLVSKRFDSPFERFAWKREVKELKFPELNPPAREGQPIPEVVRMLGRTLAKFLSNAVRELVVTISWKRGETEQTLTLSTYLINLNAEFTVGGPE